MPSVRCARHIRVRLGPDTIAFVQTCTHKRVYDLVPPPVLGGRFDVDNIKVYDFVVAVNLSDQLHDQVRNLQPGTTIGEIKIS